MKSFKVRRHYTWLIVPVGLLSLVMVAMVVAWPGAVYAAGVSVKVRAQNLSDLDTPFCGIGGGQVGDRLDASVSTDLSGVTTGTATLTRAGDVVTTLNIDAVLGFGGGILLRETSTGNVVAIWFNDDSAPFHVNVELPAGCANTVSTFTAGVDKVGVQVKAK